MLGLFASQPNGITISGSGEENLAMYLICLVSWSMQSCLFFLSARQLVATSRGHLQPNSHKSVRCIGDCIQVRKKKRLLLGKLSRDKFRSTQNCRSEEQTSAQIHPQALAGPLMNTLVWFSKAQSRVIDWHYTAWLQLSVGADAAASSSASSSRHSGPSPYNTCSMQLAQLAHRICIGSFSPV